MNDVFTSRTVVTVLIAIYLIYSIVRLFLFFRLKKKQKAFEATVIEKAAQLDADLTSRSKDFFETMHTINHEYSKLMGGMDSAEQHVAQKLQEAVKHYKEEKRKLDQDKKPDDTP
jgi:hypothetical protein